ncbi:DUF397 domain-containing protein [Micromonospora fiedleri]|uniref:DUF397 domain-containing protein n=1 Tax=Micromonospora fiedleri TaxID=1157498 RepID=A0ABS1UNV4_9ACTN|nr:MULTISPECIES: DUF397 domain-containing protein [Micromonospora]MBL6278044.1 DUF397 domain-containing protein [Micromonospora fiedleri]WSK41152.1 DUF397 domain-containing protein [Micromonospora maris]
MTDRWIDSEVVWIKSSRSTLTQECVEVAAAPTHILVRDSKDPKGGDVLAFDRPAWWNFVLGFRATRR